SLCLFVAGKGGRGSWGSCGGSGMEGKNGRSGAEQLAGKAGGGATVPTILNRGEDNNFWRFYTFGP
nr:hypothetical protein [Tanacetum cinerariifolium]